MEKMSLDQKQKWITGDEYGRERVRLIKAGVSDDAPEFKALRVRVHRRDEYLYETFGRKHISDHHGKWIAIALDGRVIIKERSSEAGTAATSEFGPGNFALRKLAEFNGYEMMS